MAMVDELSRFLTAHGPLVLLAITILGAVAMVQWRKARAEELELALKQGLLEQGMPAVEIEKLLAARAPVRKGLVEQFGALPGGTRMGLLITIFLVIICTVSIIAGTIQTYSFWSAV